MFASSFIFIGVVVVVAVASGSQEGEKKHKCREMNDKCLNRIGANLEDVIKVFYKVNSSSPESHDFTVPAKVSCFFACKWEENGLLFQNGIINVLKVENFHNKNEQLTQEQKDESKKQLRSINRSTDQTIKAGKEVDKCSIAEEVLHIGTATGILHTLPNLKYWQECYKSPPSHGEKSN